MHLDITQLFYTIMGLLSGPTTGESASIVKLSLIQKFHRVNTTTIIIIIECERINCIVLTTEEAMVT